MIYIIYAILAVLFVLFICFLTGNHKPNNQRSGLEKIGCALFTIFRKKTNEAARSIQTPRILREEALQKLDDTEKALRNSYEEGLIRLKTAKTTLETKSLPELRDQPGRLTTKAKKAKDDYEASVKAGAPVEAYKHNAIKFLEYRAKAQENIKKAEKNLVKLNVAIDTARADYDGKKEEITMLRCEINASVDIEKFEFEQSITQIKSLQTDLNNRLDEQRIRDEVEQELRDDAPVGNWEVDWEAL